MLLDDDQNRGLSASDDDDDDGVLTEALQDSGLAVPSHPLGIKPIGNAFTGSRNIKSATGLFSVLPDEIIIQIAELLHAASLLRLGATCKALYAFCHFDELWKALFIGSPPSTPTWHGTWRSTYLDVSESKLSRISCENLFSDVLHRPFFCANVSLHQYSDHIPSSNQIPRISNLSSSEFSNDWASRPFIMANALDEWPVYREWSTDTLLQQYGKLKFRAEAIDWPLEMYIDYMNNNQDESPLYLFDRSFVHTMNIATGNDKAGEFWIPQCFGKDFFTSLGDQRPDHQWLIIGPERSGSTFHKDPNATSAWNAVIRGSKYWIMFPTSSTDPPPPGVFISDDQSEVTSPLSIAEWLLGFHAEARRAPGCIEGVCAEGEVVHVPSGWWHLVVNLRPSIAITQNFVPEVHLAKVLAFLKDRPDQVSGFRNGIENPYDTFVESLQNVQPHSLEEALIKLEEMQPGRKRKWDEMKGFTGKDNEIGEFGFGFGCGDDDDEEVP